MILRNLPSLALIALLLFLLPAYSSEAQSNDTRSCQGPYKGKRIDPSQFNRILKIHFKSLESPPTAERANLCGADLRDLVLKDVNLRGANLRGANLQGVTLRRAVLLESDLRETDLQRADLTGANLRQSDLRGAKLEGAILDGADLQIANLEALDFRNVSIKASALSGAILTKANLSGVALVDSNLSGSHLEKAKLVKTDLQRTHLNDANLRDANLSYADLRDASMSEADLSGADVRGVIFELRPGTIPDVRRTARARNLWRMRYVDTPLSLAELRQEFMRSGMRDQERQVTFAMKQTERESLWEQSVSGKIESLFLLVFFECTSQYGMSPGQPLRILLKILILLIPFYMWSMVYLRPGALILATCPYDVNLENYFKDRGLFVHARPDAGELTVRLTGDFFFPNARDWVNKKDHLGLAAGLYAAGLIIGATYFSVLSAFRLGWRDLNVGTWITRIQPRDYQLRGLGWVKLVSGLQSLVSVYLLALWALTYFTRIFE